MFMGEFLLSQFAAGTIVEYIFEEKPSRYIPFRGDFPILPAWRHEEYNKNLDSCKYLNDCPEWMQIAIVKGERVRSIDEGFKDWLRKEGKFDNFFKLDKGEKATLLVKFLDENSLGLESLQIN